MLSKLVISFLCGVATIYFLFCLILNAPILSGGDVNALSKDDKHRWFWVMSMYIGKAIVLGFILAIIIGIPYIFLFVHYK